MSEDASRIPDILEHGAPVNGQPQTAESRLYMQLNVFTKKSTTRGHFLTVSQKDLERICDSLTEYELDAAVYLDVNDPSGVGVLILAENPNVFVNEIPGLMNHSFTFRHMKRRKKMTMFGRTYSLGYEPDLRESLISRPRNTVLNPDWPWAIWYPLRRNGAFARLEHKEQRQILMEHAHIGRAYGRADYAHDIRLACYGLDEADNDFVIGLLGKELYPLSRVVQDMRKTQQTALYIDSLGPFFVGKKVWSSDP